MTPEEIVAAVRSSFAAGGIPADLTQVSVSEAYREKYGAGSVGVRVEHAQSALRAPDGVECFQAAGVEIILVSKRVEVTRPFTMLLELQRRDGQLHLTAGWRSYTADPEVSPLNLFARMISAFGVPIQVGGFAEGTFVPRLTVPRFSGRSTDLFRFATAGTGDRDRLISGSVRGVPGGDLDVAWAYGFDLAAYRSAAASQRH